MACHVFPGPITPDCEGVQEAVCIHTRKVMDSCRDKDCLEDLQFFPSTASTDVLSTAVALKGGCSELLYVLVNVQPVCFKRGYYTIDMRYYYRVTLQAYQSTSVRGTEVEGLCVFDKRCMLFGSEGGSKVFTSLSTCLSGESYAGDALPIAVVEAVDPIVLSSRLQEGAPVSTITEVPACVNEAFASPIELNPASPQVLVTLGQFSIVRLERETELLIPVYDYCIPEKECCCGGGVTPCDPCEMFRCVDFPVDEFFPPRCIKSDDWKSNRLLCNCGCGNQNNED